MAETWFAIVAGDGTLLSTGTVLAPAQHYTDAGLTVLTLAGNPAGLVWDKASRSFGAAALAPNTYPAIAWIQRFTAAEFVAFKNSTDPVIQFFLFQITNATTVTPLDPMVQQGLAYAASIGLLATARVAVIGAN